MALPVQFLAAVNNARSVQWFYLGQGLNRELSKEH